MVKEYFSGVMILAIFVALSLGVAHPRLRSAVSLGAGVVLICAILLPLIDIIKGYEVNFDMDEYMNSIGADSNYDVIETAFEDGVRQYIVEKYGVPGDSVTVTCDGFRLERVRAERIYVTLRGEGVTLDCKRLEEQIAREFTDGGECEVMIRFG